MMIATLDGELRAVVGTIKNVVWCPFCDRSRAVSAPPYCEGCRAEFSEPAEAVLEVAAEEPEATESAPTRRSKAKE